MGRQLRDFNKKHVQTVGAITLLCIAVFNTAIATFYFYWKQTADSIATLWLAGIFISYALPYGVLLRKNYTTYHGRYEYAFQELIHKSGQRIYHIIIHKSESITARVGGYGRSSTVVISSALCELPYDQVKAVVAHEIGHHANNDGLFCTIVGLTLLDLLAWTSVMTARITHGGIGLVLLFSSIGSGGLLYLGTA